MDKNRTINIAGAGISGLTSAIVLSKAGYEVKVYERNDEVGKRFNGDFQGLMNWGFKEDVLNFIKGIGLDTNFWNKPLYNLDIYGPNDFKREFNIDKPYVYLVERGIGEKALDQSLKNQAINNRVEINFSSNTKGGDFDIIATGPILDGVTDAMAMGYTFETNLKDFCVMIFDDDLAYNGYSYFFIADGHGTIATCIFGNYDKISDYLDKTIKFLKGKYTFNIKDKKRFSGFGNFYLLKSDKRYVGEAGGFQDFLFGFGMRYAMITGNLAARSIIDNKNYRNLWKKELDGLLKTCISNRFWFGFLEKHSYNHFIKIWKKMDDPLDILSKIYQPSIFSKILYPIAKVYFGKYIKDRTSK